MAKKAVKKIKLPQRPFKANNNDSFANILGNLSSFWLQQTYGRRLSLLLILALVPRFLGWFQQAYITRDAYLYLSLAQSCAEGNWEEATRLLPWMPPLPFGFINSNSNRNNSRAWSCIHFYAWLFSRSFLYIFYSK